MQTIKGIPVSPGVVVGRVLRLDDGYRPVHRRTVGADRAPEELERLNGAIERSAAELRKVHARAETEMGTEAAKIFLFHIGMLADPSLVEPMRDLVEREHVSAEYAVSHVLGEWATRFAGMADSAFTTKVNDIRDLAKRVLHELSGEDDNGQMSDVRGHTVVVARDLTPSQTAAFDREKIVAIATDFGGRTSHTAIVANALHLPAVVGCQNVWRSVGDGATVIVDGDQGTVIADPDPETLEKYRLYAEKSRSIAVSLTEEAAEPAVTVDGVEIALLGNVEFPEMVSEVLECGGEGIGLYRTEFLHLTSQCDPTEEDHFIAYAQCLERLGADRPLTIRTVDLGADKYTQERSENPERNPFLGCRSIRYSLRALPMFKAQLRAILRVSAMGDVRIMFPLITTVGELRHARLIVRDVMEDLAEEGIPFDREIKTGMMVEVPSAALMATQFAREVDFFSIGTNDLVQYTLAVDRTNERVANLFNPCHPAVIRLIRDVVRAARREDVPVSCCGEAAGEVDYALLLMGLGLRTLSVTATNIPRLKRLVRSVKISQCERVARKALSFDSESMVAAFIRDRTRKIVPAIGGRSVEE